MNINSNILQGNIEPKTFSENYTNEQSANNNERIIEAQAKEKENINKSNNSPIKINIEKIDVNKEVEKIKDVAQINEDIENLKINNNIEDKKDEKTNELKKDSEKAKKEILNINEIQINEISDNKNKIKIIDKNEDNLVQKAQNKNYISSLIKQLTKDNVNMVLRNISKKKRNRKQYRRKKINSVENNIENFKKKRKLNKFPEEDLSENSFGDSIILKTKNKFLIDDKELIKKIKLSELEYKLKLKEKRKLRKKKKKKSKSKKKGSKKKKNHKKKIKKDELDNKENENKNFDSENNKELSKKKKSKTKKKKKKKLINEEDSKEKISDLDDSIVNINVIKKEKDEGDNELLPKNKIHKKRKRKKRENKFIEKIEESEESFSNNSISEKRKDNKKNKSQLSEKQKKKVINLFKNNTGNLEIKKNGIINNEAKENKNEEKVTESQDLRSSIMTDNVSNFFNNQVLQDNFSSTSYQTLQKILNKADPKPSILNKKYNLSHLYSTDILYRTSDNFKSKIFNNNCSVYSKKNDLTVNKEKFSPFCCQTTSKYATKSDFYQTKNKLYNKTERQHFLNIETEHINSDINNNNLNISNNHFKSLENQRNYLSEGKQILSINKSNLQNKTLSIKDKKEKTPSNILKTSQSTCKKSIKDFINNPYNPYSTNWQNSFLKKGFQLGIKYNNKIHLGVPSLSVKHLKKKVILPPVYNVKYNQYSDNNKELTSNENIVTYYNKDKTIKSLNLYLNIKEKSEAEMMQECKKKIMKELNIIEKEEYIESEDNENEEEEEDEEEGDEIEDDESDNEESEEEK